MCLRFSCPVCIPWGLQEGEGLLLSAAKPLLLVADLRSATTYKPPRSREEFPPAAAAKTTLREKRARELWSETKELTSPIRNLGIP